MNFYINIQFNLWTLSLDGQRGTVVGVMLETNGFGLVLNVQNDCGNHKPHLVGDVMKRLGSDTDNSRV